MNKRSNKVEPLFKTSEKEPEIISNNELTQIKFAIGKRVIEAFNFHPDSEIAFLLKISCKTVKSVTEGEEFPTAEFLLSVHKSTGVSIHWLLTGEGAKRPVPLPAEVTLMFAEEGALCGLA